MIRTEFQVSMFLQWTGLYVEAKSVLLSNPQYWLAPKAEKAIILTLHSTNQSG